MPATRFYLRSYPEPDDMAEHAASVEADGWDGLLLTDSQNLSMDVVGSLHRAAATLDRRHGGEQPHEPAPGGHGGDLRHAASRQRRARSPGDGPPTASEFDRQVQAVQAYLRGEDVDVSGFESRITWLPLAGETKVPVDVFGSGPRVITVGASHADSVTVTVGAETARVRWAVDLVRTAEATAGRSGDNVDVGAFVVVGVGTNESDLDSLVRGNASISAHFQRNTTSALSAGDAKAVDQVTQSYDFYHHGLEHAEMAEDLDDQFLQRFCVIGSPDHCIERLNELVDLGLDHMVFVGGSRDIDEGLRLRSDHLLSTEVLPALRARGG